MRESTFESAFEYYEQLVEIYRSRGFKCALAHTSHMFICIYYGYCAQMYTKGTQIRSCVHFMCVYICIL